MYVFGSGRGGMCEGEWVRGLGNRGVWDICPCLS